MSSLDIAVVMVTYKSAKLAINSLSSIASERLTPGLHIRAIVVDNASGDFEEIGQAMRLNEWSSWVDLILAPKNGGFAYGNNLGIERAFGRGNPNYFYLLNPDTEVRAGAIRSLVNFLETHPQVGIAGSGIDNPDGSEWPFAFKFPTILSEVSGGLNTGFVYRLLRRWNVAQQMARHAQPVDWVSGASMMIRSSIFATIGGLDENYFLYFEETDLCLRAKRAGFPTWYVPEGRVMHFEGQSTKIGGLRERPKRLPKYWFESRRRYFAVNHGIGRAMLIDLAAVFAYSLGFLKCLILMRTRQLIPFFVRDLIRHSVLWQRNRALAATRCYRTRI
jgi:N-acetylglucosaminyl-diphospho-decaprenol L-rhamnosyltransferase